MNELRERIVNYVPYDEQEESDKKYILKFIDTFDDVLTRKNIFGHFCSSAFVVNKPLSKDFYAIDVLPVKSHIKRGKFVSSHIHLNATYIFEADENEELLIKEDENSGVNWIDIDKMVSSSSEDHMKKVYAKLVDKLKEGDYN